MVTRYFAGHRLVFDKRGFDGAARANVAPARGERVHGVLYELEEGGLDALKGFESGYDLVDVEVERARPVGTAKVPAKTFVARPDRRTDAPPTRSYVALVLQGLEEHGLPAEARAQVEQAAGRR